MMFTSRFGLCIAYLVGAVVLVSPPLDLPLLTCRWSALGAELGFFATGGGFFRGLLGSFLTNSFFTTFVPLEAATST